MILQSFVVKSLSSAVLPKFASLIAQRYDDQYDDEDQHYDQHERPRGKIQRNRRGSGIVEFLSNQKQLGASLISFGLVLTLISMILLFNANLLRLGNISLIVGAILLMGPRNVAGYFLKESRMQATIITAIGVLLVFSGRARLGLMVEIFGVMNLFGNMFPLIFAILKTLPGVNDLISALQGDPGRYQPNNNNRRRPNSQPFSPRNFQFYPEL